MLDYKYIEQLLERYWECQTTLEEEAILREFFAQDNVPVELLKYRQLFLYAHEEPKETLGSEFDEKMMEIINSEKTVKARTISLTERLKPLMRAAAVVAVLITIGTAIEKAVDAPEAGYPDMQMPQLQSHGAVAAVDTVSAKGDVARD